MVTEKNKRGQKYLLVTSPGATDIQHDEVDEWLQGMKYKESHQDQPAFMSHYPSISCSKYIKNKTVQ